MGIHLIRFANRDARLRAIRAFYKVPASYVRFPDDILGITDEHHNALKKARIPFTYVSKKPSRKGKHASAVQS
ncbi:MAG TPA: hypothetical protein VGY58_22595 [Gemmataceae bacterium]|nr:hypothetical protein [Gemmataceae bacterium]